VFNLALHTYHLSWVRSWSTYVPPLSGCLCTEGNYMHSALPFFHTGIYTPRLHCMYGTLKLNWHVHCQYNVQVETIDIIWIYVQVIWYKSNMCIYIFSIFSVFSRHDILIVFSHWAICSICCATYSIWVLDSTQWIHHTDMW
jgi:hypothetical protein